MLCPTPFFIILSHYFFTLSVGNGDISITV
jgi:hypothetical protein